MTTNPLVTLGVLLAAGLGARALAALIRAPEMLLLVIVGAILGPHVASVIDVPSDSTGAKLISTLGVSAILFYGGLNLSLRVLHRVARASRSWLYRASFSPRWSWAPRLTSPSESAGNCRCWSEPCSRPRTRRS